MSYNETYIRTENFLVFIGISLLYVWCVPYFIMTVTYCLIARALKTNSLTHDNSRAMELRNKQNAKIVKMFVIVVIIFLLLTMPYMIFVFYSCYVDVYGTNDIDGRLHITIMYILFVMVSANGCVNPIIYAKMQRDINGYLRSIIRWILLISGQCCCVTSRNRSAPSSTWSVSSSKTERSIV